MANHLNILAFGATSAICHALLKLYAAKGATVFLVGRSADMLTALADDLSVRGAKVAGSACYDFNCSDRHQQTVAAAALAMGSIDIVVVAHGSLPEQSECESSGAAVKACMDDNFTSAAVIIHASAAQLEQQQRGTLAIISSVAGDRGRKSNYTYGAAKAGLDTLIQGLQGRFASSPVKVVNIKPGMVSSPMTQHLPQGPLFATPEGIAPRIEAAIARGRKVCYVPGYWRLIMLVIRLLPTSVLARLPI